MKNLIVLTAILSLATVSCSTGSSLFGKKTPHEKYEDKLEDAGLDDSPEGRAWRQASRTALASPVTVSIPFRQNGYFGADRPRALGLQFAGRKGQRVHFSVERKGDGRIPLYADLFQVTGSGTEHLLAADTATSNFSFDVEENGNYILRIQPQLHSGGNYVLSMTAGPALGFPVSSAKGKIGSLWGVSRDGGKRRHEGIDIFAPKGSPAVAAADGVITGVKEGGLGGKVVWLRPSGKNYTLYYAHLDKQLVREGQKVQKGDQLGTVGNTGNAKNTPAHLHFGIYTADGPIDPVLFVDKSTKAAPAVPQRPLAVVLKMTREYRPSAGEEAVKANTLLTPVAVTPDGYIAELPDGRMIQVGFTKVQVQKPAFRPLATSGSRPA